MPSFFLHFLQPLAPAEPRDAFQLGLHPRSSYHGLHPARLCLCLEALRPLAVGLVEQVSRSQSNQGFEEESLEKAPEAKA